MHICNSFDESSDEVIIIDTRDVMTDNVARIIMSAHGGQKQRGEQYHEIHALILGQLYTIVHVREGNSDRLFDVENSDYPPSLSKHGVIRSDQNSDLLPCLEVDCPSDSNEADANIFDCTNMVLF